MGTINRVYLLHVPTGEYKTIQGLVKEDMLIKAEEYVIFSVSPAIESIRLDVNRKAWIIKVEDDASEWINSPIAPEYMEQAIAAETTRKLAGS